jgi:hypothetical protein
LLKKKVLAFLNEVLHGEDPPENWQKATVIPLRRMT